MTGQRAAAEPYTTRFETQVTSIDGRRVWLETSYFFGASGGQPADRGTIGGVEVADVQFVDGEHVHVLAEEPSFRVGQHVLCSIDWSFRMYCMRAHTASHVLYGAGRRLLEDLNYGGFDISEEKVRIDFETETEIGDETLLELDALVNRVVWESRPVTWEDVPVADARERDGVAFNEATEAEALGKGRVRLVTIGSEDDNGNGNALVRRDGGSRDQWDVAACGGTHVRNTREIGPVTVLGRSNPGDGLTRIELAVGPRAIDRREAEKRVAFAARQTLDAPLEAVDGELDRLVADREELTDEVRSLRRELVESRLEEAEPFERDGLEWVATTVEDVGPNEAGEIARGAVDDVAPVVVIAGESDGPYAVVATDESISAEDVIADLTDEFGGGGGGSATLAQAGGLEAAPADVVAALIE